MAERTRSVADYFDHEGSWSSLGGTHEANRLNCFKEFVDFVPAYYCGEHEIAIRDAIWGDCLIENEGYDRLWFEMLDNDLVRRSAAIEQLTLDPYISTIPNTGYFSRWEHIWGSVVFVRKMIEQNDLDLTDREKIVLQLRTFVSDLGHTAFSHLGDWIFQGFGGAENQHDEELLHILQVSGIAAILHKYDIQPEEVVFPDIRDWIEDKSPELCVDRVDYGMREINRWQRFITNLWITQKPELFSVTQEGRLVMANEAAACQFTRCFALLPTEHWGEPVHKLQLRLLEEMVKRSFVGDHEIMGDLMSLSNRHPRDYMYAVDDDFLLNMKTGDRFMWVVRNLAEQIGQSQRIIFSQSRAPGLGSFLRGEAPLPVPGQKLAGWHGDLPQRPDNLEIIPVSSQEDVEDFGQNKYTVDFYLPPLKARLIDPPYYSKDGEIKRLSEQDEDILALHTEQRTIMRQAYVARILVSPEYKKIIERGIRKNQREWPELLTRPRMDEDEFRHILGEAAITGVVNRMIRVQWRR